MFIDRARIEVRAGKGGDGMIAFHREKYIARGGPSGGNGGRGGSIIFRATGGSSTLIQFRHSKVITAMDGGKGMGKNCYGRSAEDVYVDVPIGTVVFIEPEHLFLCDLNEEGKEFVVAKGGRGGRGNACFKSATNRTPRVAENGVPGEKRFLTLELKLLADVGFVGFPSVGKSTLLSVISNARPEIADYPFTTLTPNLGVVELNDGRSFVAADLPGLIEGAHEGKGLGLQFLRHIERCRLLLHLIDMGSDRDPYQDYLAIRHELEVYGFGLAERPSLVVASKMDEEGAEERLAELKRQLPDQEIFPISALIQDGIRPLLYRIADRLSEIPVFPLHGSDDENANYRVYEAKAESEETYDIVRKDAHTFHIVGEGVERTYQRINLSTDEGLLRLLAYLRRIGVDDRLRSMGATDGDTVILCDFEFEYID